MELLFCSFFSYLFFLTLTLIVVLISMHVRFFIMRLKRNLVPGDVKYQSFMSKMLTRRNRWMIFVFIPLGLTAVLLGPSSMIGPYQGSVLKKEVQDSTMLRIRTGGFCHRIPELEVKAYETKEPAEIQELLACLSFRPTMTGIHCMCCGDLSFEFYKGNEIAGEFSLHHDTHIRIRNRTSGDIYLTGHSCKLLDDWLTEKGIRKIQEELAAKRAEEMKRQLEEWEKEAATGER